MSRGARLVLAVLLLAGSLGARSFLAPAHVYACSCRVTTLADFVGNPDVVIVSGTISELDLTNDGHQRGVFTASRVYQGSLPAPRLPVLGGGGGDCTMNLQGMTNIVTVAQVGDNGFLIPSLCAPFGDLSTPEGRQLLAEANSTFGAATGPPVAEVPCCSGFDPVQLAIVIVMPFVGILLILGVVAVFRKRERDTEAP